MNMIPDLSDVTWADGCIYYIMSGETGRVKIGFTKGDPTKRMKSLQTGSPTKLGIVAIHPGTPDTESKLHRQFDADRVHGEWFEFSDDLIVHVADVCKMTIEFHRSAGQEPPYWATVGLKRIVDMWLEELAEYEAQNPDTIQ